MPVSDDDNDVWLSVIGVVLGTLFLAFLVYLLFYY